MHDIVIRLATLDDALAIATLAAQLGYVMPENDVACCLAELFQQANRATYVAALPEGLVVAWIDLYIHRSLLDNPLVMIGGLVVDIDQRGKGIGRCLMEYAEAWGRARGCDAVYLRIRVDRPEAHAFYEHLGYRNLKTQYAFRKEL
jgi:GNAT superfamily N-acetyltransferase